MPNGIWNIPEITMQINQKYDKALYDYDAGQKQKLFIYKTWKYELKNGMKVFLKMKFNEPEYVKKNYIDLQKKYLIAYHTSPLSSKQKNIKKKESPLKIIPQAMISFGKNISETFKDFTYLLAGKKREQDKKGDGMVQSF